MSGVGGEMVMSHAMLTLQQQGGDTIRYGIRMEIHVRYRIYLYVHMHAIRYVATLNR